MKSINNIYAHWFVSASIPFHAGKTTNWHRSRFKDTSNPTYLFSNQLASTSSVHDVFWWKRFNLVCKFHRVNRYTKHFHSHPLALKKLALIVIEIKWFLHSICADFPQQNHKSRQNESYTNSESSFRYTKINECVWIINWI